MPRQKEELLNDPGNYAILKHLAGENKVEAQRVSEETGISAERVLEKARMLEEKGFIDRESFSGGFRLEFSGEHRGNLEELKKETERFMDQHEERITEKLPEELEDLRDLSKQLEDGKKDAGRMKTEKRYRNKISSVDRAVELIEGHEGGQREKFEAFSHAHRLQVFLEEREGDFHGFNLLRKLKTLEKIEEILARRPEEKEQRRFFGNRWVSSRKLKEMDGRV